MTETGMVLSNKYRGERRPGFVGYPLPGISATLRNDGKLCLHSQPLAAPPFQVCKAAELITLGA